MRLSRSIAPLLAACSMLAAAAPAFAVDVAGVIRNVDLYRTGKGALQVETQVSVTDKSGTVEREREYTVFIQPDRKTLILMRSAAERGQKVLILGDDFWLMMPNSQRPLRITAAQKLLGDASTGDIATMRWADDYTAALVGDETCDGVACMKLELTANRRGASYQRIDLWVSKDRSVPLRADMYVQSGKLAKQARFRMDDPKAPEEVTEMTLVDQLSGAKETRIRYVTRTPKSVPQEWLNPMFLASNPQLD